VWNLTASPKKRHGSRRGAESAEQGFEKKDSSSLRLCASAPLREIFFRLATGNKKKAKKEFLSPQFAISRINFFFFNTNYPDLPGITPKTDRNNTKRTVRFVNALSFFLLHPEFGIRRNMDRAEPQRKGLHSPAAPKPWRRREHWAFRFLKMSKNIHYAIMIT
jgi:hypothetical protein